MHFTISKSTTTYPHSAMWWTRERKHTVLDAYCFIPQCYGVTNCRPPTCNLPDFSITILNSHCDIHNKSLVARRQPQIELRMLIIVLSVIKNLRNRINQNLETETSSVKRAGYRRAYLVLCVAAITTASWVTSRLHTERRRTPCKHTQWYTKFAVSFSVG
jgi:hypothetical protein